MKFSTPNEEFLHLTGSVPSCALQCWICERIKNYLETIIDKDFKYTGKAHLTSVSDQKTLNFFLQVQENEELKKFKHILYPDSEYNIKNLIQPLGIKWSFLPPEKFCGGGTRTGTMWEWEKFVVDKKNIMHHANYCFTEISKIEQLKYVKEAFNKLNWKKSEETIK